MAIQSGKGGNRLFIAALFHQGDGGIIFPVQNGGFTGLDLFFAVPVTLQGGEGGDRLFIADLFHQGDSSVISHALNGSFTGLNLRNAVSVAIQGGKGGDRFLIAALGHQSGGGIIFSVQNTNFTGLDLRFAVPVVTHGGKGNDRLFVFSLLHQLYRVPVIQSGDEDKFHHSHCCRDQNQAGGDTDIPLSPLGGFPGKEGISSFFAGLGVSGAVPIVPQFPEVIRQLTQSYNGFLRFQLGNQFLIAVLPLAVVGFFLSKLLAVQRLDFLVRLNQEFLVALLYRFSAGFLL